ncbi:hypothetical protein DXG01_006690 [Tephrocybe rancida]|nr:hypothetical protein DXG01_006690 [Tephrocybe rancida]
MDPLTSPEPRIIVERLDDTDDATDNASADMDVDLQTHFLHAQTKSFRHDGLRVEDQPMDWETYVVQEAASHPPTAGPPSSSTGEIGNQISHICADLNDIFRNEKKYIEFLSYSGDAAQDLLDLIQKLLDHTPPLEGHFRAILHVALVRLCRKSKLYPRCFSLTDVDNVTRYPLAAGGFGDVYMADYQGKAICLKVARLHHITEPSSIYKLFYREAVVWGQLSHPNILPFYGIHRLNDPDNLRICLASPWMNNSDIGKYLNQKPNADRSSLISGIAAGMKYLHDNGVVHGDLKCLNILVTDSEQACLADFGFSYVTDAIGLKDRALSSNHTQGGTGGFESPELVDSEKDESSYRRTEASDVFAFGMVCYQIFVNKFPFGKVTRLIARKKIRNGQHPERPVDGRHLEQGLTNEIWDMMKRCWAYKPDDRPTATEIVKLLPSVNRPNTGWTRVGQRRGFDMSSDQVDATITTARMHLKSLLVNHPQNSGGDIEVTL